MSGAQITITKMHGAGNDFVLIERGNLTEDYLPSLAISLCDRHFGIGADGMLVVSPSKNRVAVPTEKLGNLRFFFFR